MCVMLFVSLISSRLLLKGFGVVDYGVYNVVYGLVLFFSFMNGTLTSGTQRFLNYAMGKEDSEHLKKIFKAAFTNHLLLAVFVFFIILIGGNLMVGLLLDIPDNRLYQSYILFNTSAASLFFIMISVPYQADVIAHEDMNIYAVYSIVDSVFKLLLAFVLYLFLDSSRICVYGYGLLVISIVDFFLYYRYCTRRYSEVVTKFYWSSTTNIEMLKFCGWNTFGWAASSSAGQGVNILLNIFGGPILNAARGVSVQVYSLMNQLVNSFQNAINPQIVKSYAQGRYNDTILLLSASSKYSLILVSLVAIPVFIDIEVLLKFWLGSYPDLSLEFSRIMIIQSLIVGFTRPIVNTVHATGNIKWPCIYSGLTLFFIIPVSWLLLNMGVHPIIVLAVNILPWVIEGIINFIFLRKFIQLDVFQFIKNIVVKPFFVIFVSFILAFFYIPFLGEGLLNLILLTIVNFLCLSTLTYVFVFTNSERDKINFLIKVKFSK